MVTDHAKLERFTPTRILAKTVPAGSYVLNATVNTVAYVANQLNRGEQDRLNCELRNGTGNDPVGYATDRRTIPGANDGFEQYNGERSLALNGTALVPAGGAEVSVWCTTDTQEFLNGNAPSQLRISVDSISP